MKIKKVLKYIFYSFIFLFIALGIIGFIWMMTESSEFWDYCAKEKGGKKSQGYCVYVEQGTSQSLSVFEWREFAEEDKGVKHG